MKRAIFILGLLILFGTQSAIMQGDDGTSWPPDPAKIFAPNVEVISTSSGPAVENVSWVFVTDPDTNAVHLYNQKTGETSDPLPLSDVNLELSDIEPSPRQDWLLLLLQNNGLYSGGLEYTVFSYDIDTGLFNLLGQQPGILMMLVHKWLDDVHATLAIAEINGGSGAAILDVSTPDSFEILFRGESKAILRTTDRPHYEIFHGCTLDLYDIESRERSSFPLGTRCNGVFTNDDVHYYAVIPGQMPSDSSVLSVLDTKTGGETVIFEGEIELLYSISPNGRYAAFVMDDNGQVDCCQMGFSWSQTHNLSLIFYDTERKDVVYGVPIEIFSLDSTIILGDIMRPQRWVDSSTAWVSGGENHQDILLEFGEDGVTETVLPFIEGVIPAERQVLTAESFLDPSSYRIYDITTGQTLRIYTEAIEANAYRFWTDISEQGQLRVSITDVETGEGPIVYILRVRP